MTTPAAVLGRDRGDLVGRLVALAGSRELRRFLAVGLLNTATDMGVFNAVHFGAGVGAITAKLISALLATICSYLLTRLWAFSGRAHRLSPASLLAFVAINAASVAFSVGCVAAIRYGLGRDDVVSLVLVANGLGIGGGVVWRYWALRRWVFRAASELEVTEVLNVAA